MWKDLPGQKWRQRGIKHVFQHSPTTAMSQEKQKANCVIEGSDVTEQRKLRQDAEVLMKCPHVAAGAAPY